MKITTFKCDRCGDAFPDVSYNYESRTEIDSTFVIDECSTGKHLYKSHIDLCKKCSREFKEFMEAKSKKK